MMKLINIYLILLFFSTTCFGQKFERFSVSAEGGLLIGEKLNSESWEVNPGFRIKSWIPGVTMGADYYQLKTYMPGVFLKKFLKSQGLSPYAYVESGFAIASMKEKDMKFDLVDVHFSDRIFYEGGLGYRLPISKKFAALMSFGYSRKDMFFTGYYKTSYNNPGLEAASDYSFRMRRYKLKVGIIF